MKRLLLSLITFATLSLYAQDIPLKNGSIHYELIDSASGTKGELMSATKSLINDLISGSSITNQDEAAGLIEGKGAFLYDYKISFSRYTNRVLFNYSIAFKDGKYRVQLYNFTEYDKDSPRETPQPVSIEFKFKSKADQKWQQEKLQNFDEGVRSIMFAFQSGIKKKIEDIKW